LIRAAQGSDPSINLPASHPLSQHLRLQSTLRDTGGVHAELQPLSVVPAAPCEAFSKKQRKIWLSRVGVSSWCLTCRLLGLVRIPGQRVVVGSPTNLSL